MIDTKETCVAMINSPVRRIRARVELYTGSTLLQTFYYTDALKEFTVERVGESKFFGFGVCQKLNVKLRDKERALSITTANRLEICFGVGCDYIYTCPSFYVTEVHRDEVTNELSITAYDALYKASVHKLQEVTVIKPYTVLELAQACAGFLGLPLKVANITDESFNTLYEDGANFDGTESIREVLNAIAEATQSIYYINYLWELTFKRLENSAEAALEIGKDKYFELDSGDNKRLGAVCHATELGDNVIAKTEAAGSTQYVRNNPLWDLREDIATLVNNALAAVGGLTINQFSCSWRGNFLLEIGDKIALIDRENNKVFSFVLNDSYTYDGALSQETQWSFENDTESEANPVSLGDTLKRTYARVDKANRQIELLASDINQSKETISSLQVNADNITATVTTLQDNTNAAINSLNESLEKVSSQVSAKMSAEDVQIKIEQELANGVDKVVTSTGFTFNEEGLTVSKTGSEMTTTITEDGMKVYRDNTAVLTANNTGVDAVNLHASTFLIVGGLSRFETYGGNRTGCFWIGG